MSMYADDTSLCYQSHDLTRLNEAINSDLKKLDTWLQGNKLSLNVAKTQSMLISTKQKQNSLKSQNKDMPSFFRLAKSFLPNLSTQALWSYTFDAAVPSGAAPL